MKYNIGIVGLGVMGAALGENLISRGYAVSGFDLDAIKVNAFIGLGCASLAQLCDSLERPRRIILMVNAGKAVDAVLDELLPLLDRRDILIDGGNSFYIDTERRQEQCLKNGVRLLGMGVSGGQEGAKAGPALMPGGDRAAWAETSELLQSIAASVDGLPCCDYIGPGGSGHFVKMVHNGIEYALMELICEVRYLLKTVFGLSPDATAEVFEDWNRGELNSYLMEITSHILKTRDPESGAPLVEQIRGEAGSKGTGLWTSREALELGAAAPVITEAVFARYLSTMSPLGERRTEPYIDGCASVEDLRRGLFASVICAYAQGFDILSTASAAKGWDIDLSRIALLFRGGCIIRAGILDEIAGAAQSGVMSYFAPRLDEYQCSWRKAACMGISNGIPLPALCSSLAYYDGLRAPGCQMDLLQAQRDYFGAHTFRRRDRDGVFHFDW